LPNVIGLRKEDELNWDCVTQTGKMRNAYKILVKEVLGGGGGRGTSENRGKKGEKN